MFIVLSYYSDGSRYPKLRFVPSDYEGGQNQRPIENFVTELLDTIVAEQYGDVLEVYYTDGVCANSRVYPPNFKESE